MAQTKLSIDLGKGMVDVEGEEAFVKSVYEDFKKVLLAGGGTASAKAAGEKVEDPESQADVGLKEAATPPSRKPRRKSAKPTEGATGIPNAYKPEQDLEVDLSGLPAFYGKFKTKNHPEKILIFARFLQDEKGIAPCTLNQIYSCYRLLRIKVPTAYLQAFRDTQNKHRFIKLNSPTNVEITLLGNNHFEHDLAPATLEAAAE